MLGYLEIACGLAAVLVGLYYYCTATYDFWEKRGVKGPRPLPLIGNFAALIVQRYSPGEHLKRIYHQFPNEPMIGIFALRTPLLILNDPELIKDVLIKDFSKFASRGIHMTEKAEPLSSHMLFLEPRRWRPLRLKLSPLFSSSKLKDMFAMILDCSDNLEKHLEKVTARGGPVNILELTANFTIDVIGSCNFGIQTKALDTEDNKFRAMGKQVFRISRIREVSAAFYDLIGPWILSRDVTNFTLNLVKDSIKYRKENNIVRNDFLNILADLQDHPEKLGGIEVTLPLLAAQAFLFLGAGSQTSSTTMSNAIYELAMHQDIQDKLRKEIKETFEKNNGDLSYETLNGMKYLDMVIRETLRKYPSGNFIPREALAEYTFKDTKVSIPKGMRVWISAHGIQHDPKLYPDPEKFHPPRFTEEEIAKRHPMTFLPFGVGPRSCMAARFAMCMMKIGLIKVLHQYRASVCKETPIPYKHDTTTLMLAPIGALPLMITKLEATK